jgi:hypothetical protein
MIMNMPFYVRWLAVGCFVAFVTIVCLLTFDHTAIWVAWAGLAIEAAITARVVVGTWVVKPRHPSTIRAKRAAAGDARRSRPGSD